MSRSPLPILQVQSLHKRFHQQDVLNDINLTVAKGETVCILGPSGSGKSTLLRCLNWLEAPDSGSIRLLGEPMGVYSDGNPMRDRDMALQRTRIGMVFQHFALWPHLTVLQNIMEAPLHVQKRPFDEVLKEAETLLDMIGLANKRDAYPARLSGGQKQRIGIARALAVRPPLIMFDEPTSALDPELVGDVLNIMQDLAAQGLTMLVVTHEMDFAREMADRIVFMDQGRIVEIGTPDEFFLNPQTARAKTFLSRPGRRASSPLESKYA